MGWRHLVLQCQGQCRRMVRRGRMEAEAVLLSAQRSGREHAKRSTDDAHLIGQNVAKHILGEEDVELIRVACGCMAALSTYMWLSSISGAFFAKYSVTTLRQSTEVSSTFALSTEQTRLPRAFAVSLATCAIRSISLVL